MSSGSRSGRGGSRRRSPAATGHAISVAPRSALDGAALDPSPDARVPIQGPGGPSAGRRRLPVLLAAGVIVGAAFLAAAGARVVLARFTDAAAVGSSSFATGTWATATTWYLHNNPTPPTTNTTAQFNLALSATAPTAATLYNHDTNCESRAGRSINRNTGLLSEATTCRYATWRTAALATARTLTGTATLAVWARKTTANGTNPTLRAFLRVFDPATSTYTELGTANATVVSNPTVAWARLNLTWSLASVAVPGGRQIEVKVVATGGNRNVEIAYDATAYPSSLSLP